MDDYTKNRINYVGKCVGVFLACLIIVSIITLTFLSIYL